MIRLTVLLLLISNYSFAAMSYGVEYRMSDRDSIVIETLGDAPAGTEYVRCVSSQCYTIKDGLPIIPSSKYLVKDGIYVVEKEGDFSL